MLRIECPYCGLRDQTEFRYGGEASRTRPEVPDSTTDREWADYLFYRDNPKGPLQERWVHSYGCGQWFVVLRDTLTHEMSRTGPIDEATTGPGQGHD